MIPWFPFAFVSRTESITIDTFATKTEDLKVLKFMLRNDTSTTVALEAFNVSVLIAPFDVKSHIKSPDGLSPVKRSFGCNV